jgi:hypothetical protein
MIKKTHRETKTTDTQVTHSKITYFIEKASKGGKEEEEFTSHRASPSQSSRLMDLHACLFAF